MSSNAFLERVPVPRLDVHQGVLTSVEDDVVDSILDAVRGVLEKIAGDLPGTEDPASYHSVQLQSVHDHPVTVLDDRVTVLDPEEHDVPTATHHLQGIVQGGIEARHLERDVHADSIGEIQNRLAQLWVTRVGPVLGRGLGQ